MCGSCLASLLLFMIFPTSRLGWVNLLTACSLLFALVLLFAVMVSSGLCLALCVFYNVSRVIYTVCWFSRLVVLVLS